MRVLGVNMNGIWCRVSLLMIFSRTPKFDLICC